MSENTKQKMIDVITKLLPAILFIVLWFILTPYRDLSAQVNKHEVRLTSQEVLVDNLIKSYDKDVSNINAKLDKILDLHIK